jgi:acyl-CoA dehydrogenase
MVALEIAILILAVLGLGYLRASSRVWSLAIGLILFYLTIDGELGDLFLFCCWFIYLACVFFVNFRGLRQRYFTGPLIRYLQKRMPAISDTEREAIEAGNVWWEKELFCGQPDWKKLLAMPVPKLTIEEQEFIDNQVETLCAMLNDWQIMNETHDLPKSVWDYIKQERFFGLVIPKQYQGRGFSALAHSTIVGKIATRCLSAAVDVMVPNSLGPGELLLHYGTDQQKQYYLPRLAKGEEVPCFALTSPEAGSDAGSIIDSGIICRGQYEGKEVLGIRLNWDKRYITLAPVATVLGLAFRLYDPEHLFGDEEEIGITLCLVPTQLPGIEMGRRHYPMHFAFLNGPTRGKDVFVPMDFIIGGPLMAGQGWRMLMECLSVGRAISLPALGTACGKLSYRLAGAYARLRKQFHLSIAEFEGVGEALGNIAGYTYMLEATRIMTVSAVDQGLRPAIASAIAKYHMTEMARKVIGHAMDVHAGHAIQMGPRNQLAQAHMSIPISITVEGANILTRNLIIFGQGAIRCHPYILDEIKLFAEKDSVQRTQKLDQLLMSHVGYALSNIVRTFCRGLTGGRFIFSPKPGPVAYYYRQMTRMSSALAMLADVSMLLLGGKLKRKERLSARLGDMLSHLYLASAVLKYYQNNGEPTADLDYVRWSVEHCLAEIQSGCDELLDNFPLRKMGKILRWIIFPLGTAYRKPCDLLSQQIVGAMLTPSDFRERLTAYCYVGKKADDPMNNIEKALALAVQTEPLWSKLKGAIQSGTVPKRAALAEQLQVAVKAKLFTQDEVILLNNFEEQRKQVIQVNEFSFDLRTVIV